MTGRSLMGPRAVACLLALCLATPVAGAETVVDAVKRGDTAAARALVRKGVDVNIPERDGTTALHWAVYRDDAAAVDLLLGAGARATTANRYGVAPLSLAAVNGNATVMERLLKAGADPDTAQPGGETALMTAARTGRVEALKLLLAHKANVNARDAWKQQTALMWASAANNAAAVRALIEAGAEVGARSRVSGPLSSYEVGDSGFTALLFAARGGAIDAMRALVDGGASVNDATGDDGTSALVLAVMAAQYDTALALLQAGADPNGAGQGWTALHQIVYTRRPNQGLNAIGPLPRGSVDSLSLVRALIDKGANVNARLTKQPSTVYIGRNALDQIGATPFLLAASRFDVELMQLLRSRGADPLAPTADGTTPLMVAAGVGMHNLGENPGTPEEVAEAVKLCLALGNDPKAVNKKGETALHGTAQTGANAAVQMLVAAGTPLEAKDRRGFTAHNVASGLNIGGTFKAWPETAILLRKLMTERGIPIEDNRGNGTTLPGVGAQ